jgi:hypothetical protein
MHKQLIIGLPETGKTTFLAALWHVVTSKEVSESLRLLRFEGDRKHLNKIRKAWLTFKEVGRTVQATEQIVTMRLTAPNGAEPVEIVFPDMSGESFRQQWVDRKWTKEYDALVSEATGILLFVHSMKAMSPVRIDSDMADAVSALSGPEDMEDDASAIDLEPSLLQWNPKHTPTQVQLVELLQFVDQRRQDWRILPVAVVISAWDLVTGNYETPEDWLSRRLPLLDQYLRSNVERFPARVYGISAQGAPLEGDLSALEEHEHQSDRIIVVGKDCAAHDITAPIKWGMGAD